MLVEQTVQTQAEAQATLTQVRKGEVDGILMPGSLSLNIPGFIVETARQQSIPTMYYGVFFVDKGEGLGT